MINEGRKNKPLDRYPYMENDLKGIISEPKIISEDYSEVLEYVNPNIRVTEFRLVDCGIFYYALIKVQFLHDFDVGANIRLIDFLNKYMSSVATQGIVNSFYFLGYSTFNRVRVYIKKIADVNLVEISDLDNPSGGIIFSNFWLK